jgi:hypothetical protein
MKATTLERALIGAAILAMVPTAAVAQDELKERAAEIAEQANEVQEQAGELANDVANTEATREADGQEERAAADGALADGDGVGDGADDDDDGFDWGLLGLLGLAGLLGLKRRDDRTVHTDSRRDTRL